MDFYQKITDLCNKKNITIKELERELHLSNGIIGKWRNSSPNIKYLLEICRYFDIGIEELCYNINISKDEKLLQYFHESDERGQNTILSVAELEAKRCKKIVTWKQTAGDEQEKQDEKNELKPFA